MQLVSFETQAKMVKFIIYLYKRGKWLIIVSYKLEKYLQIWISTRITAFIQSPNVHPNSTLIFAYWTSGNNRAKANQFVWETVNIPVEYFHWQNKGTEAPEGKGCILMGLKTFGRWTNESCETPHLFICEKPK